MSVLRRNDFVEVRALAQSADVQIARMHRACKPRTQYSSRLLHFIPEEFGRGRGRVTFTAFKRVVGLEYSSISNARILIPIAVVVAACCGRNKTSSNNRSSSSSSNGNNNSLSQHYEQTYASII